VQNPGSRGSEKTIGEMRAATAAAAASAGQLYLDYAPLLRRVAVRKFNVPPAEAEALVHDVFINYLVTPRKVVDRHLRAYLIASVCNASRNYWRSRHTEARVFTADPCDASRAAAGEDTFEGLARNLTVASTLAKLGARCRELLHRYYLRGETTPAVAAAMQTTASNVNYLMHMCRKRARAIYERITRVGE
jgi:RNA polymerase sigma factor (sigma-70 family)